MSVAIMHLSVFSVVLLFLPSAYPGVDNLALPNARYLLNLGREFTQLFRNVRTPPQYAVLTVNGAGRDRNFDPCTLSFDDTPLTPSQNYVARIRITANQPGGPDHSERRVLSHLENLLTINRPVSSVHIYTINSPCRGCAREIARVARAHPTIQFYVGYTRVFTPSGNPPSVGQDILQFTRQQFRNVPNIHFAQLDPSCLQPLPSDRHDELRKKRSIWWPFSDETKCRIDNRQTEGTCVFNNGATGIVPFSRYGLLKHMDSGLCIHPLGGRHDPSQDTPVVIHGCDADRENGHARITWGITPSKRIIHLSSGKCLKQRGDKVVLNKDYCWSDNGVQSNTWKQTRFNDVFLADNSKCWYVGSRDYDTRVTLQQCSNIPWNHHFNFVLHSALPVYVAYGRIRHSGGRCVHPLRGAYNPNNDTPLVLHECDTTPERNYARITFGLTSRGHIIHVSSGKCVHVYHGQAQPRDNTGIVLHSDNCWGSDRSDIQWDLTRGGSIAQITSGKCWHPLLGAIRPGKDTRLVVYGLCDIERIKFTFIE